MFKQAGKFAELKGRTAEVRHLGKPLLSVWSDLFDPTIKEHRWIRLALTASVAIEDLLDVNRGNFVLDHADAQSLIKHTFNLMGLVTALGNVYHPEGVLIFHYTIKCHYLLHSALMGAYLNPSMGWNYSGEDYMCVAKTLLSSCQKGNKPQKALALAMLKYCYGLSLRMMKRESIWKHN